MNLLKTLATVSGMTLISRILGFVRDAVIARAFGAGMATDAFFVAFKLPNLLRRLFAEGAFSQAFVPILAEYKNQRGHKATAALVANTAGVLLSVLTLVSALGMLAAPWVVWISAPGFAQNATKFALTVDLLRITFPYIVFISLVSLAGSVLNTYSQFSVPALTPTLLNISLIVFAAFLAPYFDPPALALGWAVFMAGVFQLSFQIPYLRRIGMLKPLRFHWRDAGVRRILKLMAPAVLGVSISQISLLINTIFASLMKEGGVSWLYYADRLMEFPSGMLGVALGTILLPSLAKLHANKQHEQYAELLDWGLRLTFLLTLPSAVGLGILATPLIATLFHYGAFTANDVLMTEQALLAYSVGLIGIILVKVLAPAFYARQDIKTPVRIGIATLLLTQLLNLVFYKTLHHAGLALAIGLGACANASLLFWQLRQRGIYLAQPGWGFFLVRIGGALCLMASALLWGMGNKELWLTLHGLPRVLRLSGVIFLGAGVYFAALWLQGFRLRDFKRHAA